MLVLVRIQEIGTNIDDSETVWHTNTLDRDIPELSGLSDKQVEQAITDAIEERGWPVML